jgi:DNA-binding CsgD family transcriptional regulator
MRARSISLMVADAVSGRSEVLSHAGIAVEAVEVYRRYYRHVDLWTTRAAAAALGGPGLPVLASGEMLVPDREFLRSEFYGDFGRHHGLRYVVGTVVPLGAGRVMPIGLHRPEGAERFGQPEKRLLGLLLPHLRQAIQLRTRLAVAGGEGLGTAALDALHHGVVVVDGEMNVLLANIAAERLTAPEGGGLRLLRERARGGLVARACRHVEREALRRLVRATALDGQAGGAVRLHDAEDAPALAVLVSPLPARLAGGDGLGRIEGRALLLLRGLGAERDGPPAELLRNLFGLTAAEAAVACALAGGATKAAVAAARGLRETTVRTQVRSVLEKTGTRSLRELEGLLAGL